MPTAAYPNRARIISHADIDFSGEEQQLHGYEIGEHVVAPMASMSRGLHRHPFFSATYAAADAGVAQNMLWPPSPGYAMQTQNGAMGPAGGSPAFVNEVAQ